MRSGAVPVRRLITGALSPGTKATAVDRGNRLVTRAGAGCRACSVRTVGLGRTCARRCPRWRWRGSRTLDGDLDRPGIAIDETAQLKHGDAPRVRAPQHAGCTGRWKLRHHRVSPPASPAHGQAWADFDVYMPDGGRGICPGAGPPGSRTIWSLPRKPQLAMRQLDRLTAAGLPARWVAFDEVYGRSEKLRKKAAEKAGWRMWRSSRATTRSPAVRHGDPR